MAESDRQLLEVRPEALLEKVTELKTRGYRLVQICSTTLKDCYEMTYSFSIEYDLLNLRFTVKAGEKVPSISHIYPSAYFYENEIHDLFGVPIEFMTVDYKGRLYRTAVKAPYKLKQEEEGGGPK
ncbi:MAG TPA: NADH dehydrogenase subunit [Ruminococcaceae bacterium]|jgi:ech hydrogenase subunit D|nr:NADH dehydrogenase subunit [Oscillospiraceae bacterium]HBQ46278.1 NADH dehydrogenase subunit [Oscillospiraceae bacterium]HBT91204.1 NADH dehydrogenase subunit [Oscillospiraceae bacterium]HCB92096.1 NADH dehydrogenase subunit [Oscillospiraceae bacterium]